LFRNTELATKSFRFDLSREKNRPNPNGAEQKAAEEILVQTETAKAAA